MSVGYLTSVLDVPKINPTITTNSENLHFPAFDLVDEIINFKTSLVLDQKVNAVGTGVTIIGVASTYNPYRPGRLEGASKPPPESRTIQSSGQPQSKSICVGGLAVSAMAGNIDPRMPWLRASTRRSSSK